MERLVLDNVTQRLAAELVCDQTLKLIHEKVVDGVTARQNLGFSELPSILQVC